MDIYKILENFQSLEKKAVEKTTPVDPVVEDSGVKQALSAVAKDLAEFTRTGQLSDELYNAAFDYYSNTGEMPYGAATASDTDPYEWVADQLNKDLGLNEVSNAELDAQAIAQHRARIARQRNRRAAMAPASADVDRSRIPAALRKARGEEELSYKEIKEDNADGAVAAAITRRVLIQHPDLLQAHGPEAVLQAIDAVASGIDLGADDEIGSSDVSGWVKQVVSNLADSEQGVAEGSSKEGKEIDYKSLEVDGIDYNDAPEFVDAYFSDGYYTDGTQLSDEDLEELSSDYDLVHQYVNDRLYETDVGEGNAFSKAVRDAKADGIQPGEKITVSGKTYPVKESKKAKPDFLDLDKDGDKKEPMKKAAKEKIDEVFPGTPEYELRFGKPDSASAFDKKKVSTGTVYTRRHKEEPEADDTDAPKKKGRPAGSKRALGAKGPSGQSKLLKGKGGLKEQDIDVVDRGEYDREGDMAHGQLHTLKDAAEELCNLVSPDQNLPEWVQSKITKAMDYLDTARDYIKSQREMDQEEMAEGSTGDYSAKKARAGKDIGKPGKQFAKIAKSAGEKYGSKERGEKVAGAVLAKLRAKEGVEPVEEKAVSKAQQKFMGMVHAAQKGEKPASKEVAKVAKSMSKKDAKDFAATKHKGLPEKKKKEVEETTVAGSVAPSVESPKKAKGGMEFGKGVYEGALAESFDKKLSSVLNESTNLNISTDDQGQKSVSVSATGADADMLGDLLKMAGLFSSSGYKQVGAGTCDVCGGAEGMHEDDCSYRMDEELANSPDEVYGDMDMMLNKLSGGLNGPKSTGQTTGPIVNRQDSRQGVMAEAEQVKTEAESRLWSLYKKIDK